MYVRHSNIKMLKIPRTGDHSTSQFVQIEATIQKTFTFGVVLVGVFLAVFAVVVMVVVLVLVIFLLILIVILILEVSSWSFAGTSEGAGYKPTNKQTHRYCHLKTQPSKRLIE